MTLKATSPRVASTEIEQRGGIWPTLAYVAPFAVFVALLALRPWLSPELLLPLRFVLVASALAAFSRRVIPWRPAFLLSSVLLGAVVFAIWIGPDRIWGPGYRDLWLFRNSLIGATPNPLFPRLRNHLFFVVLRVLESAILVPVSEELFWRGWLMRWLIRSDFLQVPVGLYAPFSFWMTVLLFASEHGPYWEVGLIAGVAYNWWLVRTRNLADCILAHCVTNALLAGYVLLFAQWQYWL
jgi:CAAX prenyl protease-like protein